MKYIHYGSNKFDPQEFLPIVNQTRNWTKPKQGGLWASPIDAKYGWKQWCIDEDFNLLNLSAHFDFQLKSEAEIYRIDSAKSLKLFVHMFPGAEMSELDRLAYDLDTDYWPDYRKASEMYDGVEVSLSDCPQLYRWLYGWDCDSIVVWNLSVVDPC